ncbi:DMT family transporter [Paenarthrobacter sp. PH39-S1]|uniref:DMT family transporter n=1 Tax=Paenarthrobacter sp. PH39-S1 TaxID=3046204 RepID=UPI0024BA33B8|nr:DMT family transporter [Paenarthrobacter sp. PH39-S1]MDJ0355765.1 DMT family transporter [Paenarthrobacter sp. PH39-S1]
MNYLLAALGVIGVSASGPIMAATAAPALAIAFWRNSLGAVIMGVPAGIRQRTRFRQLGTAEYQWSAIAAVALALHFACFISALKLTSVAAATALVCLQAAWIAFYQLFGGIRPARAVLGGLGMALAGVLVISGFDLTVSPEAILGDGLAVAGGALAAFYTMAGGQARRTMSTGVYTTLCYGACALLLAVMCAALGQPLTGFDGKAWLGILAVTLVAQIMGHSIFNHLLATISPLVVSMIILLEIPGAAVLAAVFLGEKLPGGTYVGLGLILVGLAVVVLRQGRSGVKAPHPPQ